MLKKIKISQLHLHAHSKMTEVTKNDALNLQLSVEVHELSEDRLSILFGSIVLNVIAVAGGQYLLLSPNLIFNQLCLHPAAGKMHVNLQVHSPEGDKDLNVLLDTLNLVLPALMFIESANKSKTISERYSQLKAMGGSPASLTLLAKLANKNKSTFRK